MSPPSSASSAWRRRSKANRLTAAVSSKSMPLPFHLVDAFTDRPFAGNPAAVYVLDRWPDNVWLQQVAREMSQSETAFLVRDGAGFRLRWFTPRIEVDLCGHATLAAAHVL